MALQIRDILDAVVSHAAASGHFERVNGHEPVNPPGNGLTAAVWTDDVMPVRTSGLNSTSSLLVVSVRAYIPADAEPLDMVDPDFLAAVDTLLAAYVGDFTLGGLVRQVDVFGAHGTPLRARAGYIEMSDQVYRAYTLSLPLVVNDLWEQSA